MWTFLNSRGRGTKRRRDERTKRRRDEGKKRRRDEETKSEGKKGPPLIFYEEAGKG